MPSPSAVIPPAFVLSSGQVGAAAGLVALPLLDDDGALTLGPGAADLQDQLGDLDLLAMFEQAGAGTAAGQVARLPLPGRTVLGIGLGDGGSDAHRAAGAALARAAVGADEVVSTVQATADDDGLTAFVAGAVLASFRFTLRTAPADGTTDAPVGRIVLAGTAPERQDVLDRATAIARASAEARRLATTPSNIKSPKWLADEAGRLMTGDRVRTKVWDRAALEKDGFGGILAVGQASSTPPYLVQAEYSPAKGARRAPHVVLVGKGITFDTGGLSIKPGESMVTMKRDMTGAAVVAATMSALAAVDCPVRVTGLMPIAENAISGSALRPGDVITHWGGRTTEVTNTDAEGRLVLADGLAYAAARLKPDLLVDVATLTGGIKVALGLSTGGYFATDDAAAAALEQASMVSGERLWRMPLAEEYESFLASKVADADNAPGRAPAITAALFLQHFTSSLPWVHLDIASVGDAPRDAGEWTPGPTGFGVRLLLHWLGSAAPLEGVGR
ncbi:leucyl aminopeptidase family protein [Nocardioides marmoriginsengisoli]|uniref:leucyl aminopeptidase family protein n=1 Tax=Nocardioides marmoriginsengisoli TaxID=661483 RepID=UPI001FE5291C|nr:leucyl aminopeptidase family protein [Nocardioides marmoriginsengisoli]